jgi:hypothetical protein
MAVPAGIGRRDVRMGRLVDEVVAVAAIKTQDGVGPSVEGVVKRDRLIRRVSNVQILVRRVLVDRGHDDDSRDEQADEDLQRGGVDGPDEEVATRGRAVEEFEEFAHRVQTNGLAGFLTEVARKAEPLRNPNLRGFSRFSGVGWEFMDEKPVNRV